MKYRNLGIALVYGAVVLSVVAGVRPLDIGAQSPNQVGLVVRMGDGAVVTRCVEFAEDEISGYDLLMRSGLTVVATQSGGIGVTICEIDGVGCPANNCFCKCSGSTCTYWSYWRLVGGEWSYASVGAMGRQLYSGDVDGWTWGQGDPPPVLSLTEICAPPATATSTVPPSPTPLPTETPTLVPTATAGTATHTPQPANTATVLPAATWTPTFSPTASPTPPPSATPTDSVTLQAPTATLSSTPLPQSVATQRTTLAASQKHGEERSNYILFGVLVAGLAGVIVVIGLRRKG